MVTAELPTGTITFLFTDIEGSTRLWEEAPEEMSRAIARHDELVDKIVAGSGGFLHRARGEGDSEFAVFQSAGDAVAAAVLIQKQFFAEPWATPRPLKIRMSLHTGKADLRLGDYYGTEVNRTARLRGIAHGGQVLLSGATYGLVQAALPGGVSVQDKGEVRLRDIARPEHVYQLVIPGLPSDFPPLKARGRVPTNIPAQATPFVGREEEAARLRALLAQEAIRLITIIGPGGTGKTRLAIEVATQQGARFQDGVFFVPLAPLTDPGQIVQTITEAASISIVSGDDLEAQLLRYLRRKQILLVLDNFEHLLDGARFLNDILQAAPDVSILATSREKLNLSGESILALGGLQVDDWHRLEDVLADSAGQLFVQSAQRVEPGFQLDDADVPQVTRICRLVQGMPLAILLAASWADMLSPAEIAAEIENSLDFLETELRDIPARQRSIRAVFEGSWEKLATDERELFKRLSVFRGSFTREAAAEVAGASLRSLARLVNKSFLHRDPESGRYELHELLRQYAEERLQAAPKAATAVREAHVAYFADLMVKMSEPLRSNRQRETLDEIEADIENVRSAWRHLADQGRTSEMGRIIEPLWYVHELRGWYHAGLGIFSDAERTLQALIDDKDCAVVTAQIQAIRGVYLTILGSPRQGLALGEASLATFRKLDRPRQSLLTYLSLGVTNFFLSRGEDAIQVGLELKEISATLEDDWWIAFSFNLLGSACMTARAFKDARQYAGKSAKLWERIGDPWGSIWPGTVLAGLAAIEGNDAEARKRYQFVLDTAQSINFKRGMQYTLISLGKVSYRLGNYRDAEDYYLQSLRISDETGQTREMLATLYDLAQLRAETDRDGEAVEMLSIILQHPARFQHGLFRRVSIEEDAQVLRSELEGRLAPQLYAAAWKRGTGRELQDAVDEVLAVGLAQS